MEDLYNIEFDKWVVLVKGHKMGSLYSIGEVLIDFIPLQKGLALVESPMKYAHKKAIKQAQTKGSLISFDPNVSLPLWDCPEACREAILEFIPMADIIKISDEELSFITGFDDETEAISSLFTGHVKVVIYTKGAMGATLYGRDFSYISKGYSVNVQDTTGAGDAFIGAFLHHLLENGIHTSQLEEFSRKNHEKLLAFSNACGALTTMGKGAIGSLPTKEQIIELVTRGYFTL